MPPKHKQPQGEETQFITAATPLVKVILKNPLLRKWAIGLAIGYAAIGRDVLPVDGMLPGIKRHEGVSPTEFHALEARVGNLDSDVRSNMRAQSAAIQQLAGEVSNLRGRAGLDWQPQTVATNGVDWRHQAMEEGSR